MIPPLTLSAVLREPPLDPDGDRARQLLRGELTDPRYVDRGFLERLVTWIGRQVDRAVGAAGSMSGLTLALAVLVVVALTVAVIVLISRARWNARAGTDRVRPVFSAEAVDAVTLRARAEAALAAGDARSALVDAFRALAVHQIERGLILDHPQATAHEVARAIGTALPAYADRVGAAADLFDSVLYGDVGAGTDQARWLLDLEDLVAGERVRP